MAIQHVFGYLCDITLCSERKNSGNKNYNKINSGIWNEVDNCCNYKNDNIKNTNKLSTIVQCTRKNYDNNAIERCNHKKWYSETESDLNEYRKFDNFNCLRDYYGQQCKLIEVLLMAIYKCASVNGLVAFLLILSIGLSTVNGDSNIQQHIDEPAYGVSKEFSNYAIIRPIVQHSRNKRDILSTRLNNGAHVNDITLKYNFQGKDVIIDLKLNEDLTPYGHFLRYQRPNGDKIVQNLTKTDVDLCHYKGTVRNKDRSRAAISTCDGINGVIFDEDETYYIKSKPNITKMDADHFLYRHSDMTQTTRCGYEGGINKTHDIDYYINSSHNSIKRFKRSSAADTIIRGPYNANKHSSFVELVLVIDNKIYNALGENLKRVHSHCIEIANIINALYVPLNIFIALVGVVVWNENNEIEISSNGDVTLKNFLNYRRQVLVIDHPNDNAQLLTKEQFSGGIVGKALKGPMCTYEFSGGVSMDHSQIVSVVASTVAHEMGHNFGMEHDDKDCKCVDERCIMSASSSSTALRHWSSCSVDQLNLAFHQGINYCLRNKPTKLFDSPQCGNGFVEPGEQCDCGLPDTCKNTCCEPNTCMLHTNASCATGECCDLTTCHPRTAGTTCRESAGECDLPEYCTGQSEYCPEDYFKRDTEICDDGKAYCYQGNCRSRSDQCKVLWGPSGNSSDPCYEKNLNGTRHGNCGYDRRANVYMNCSHEDIYCGMLQCRHLNERLEFGMESVSLLSHSYIPHGGIIIPCRTAIVDLGLQSIDPGLVPDGAKCAEEKMCLRQKCISLESLRVNGMAPECPENCSSNGICNNKGHCHCEIGFGPPLCNIPGPGGSDISGPATNPNDGNGFARIMYVFFLGVVPFVSLILFGIYYWRHQKPLLLRKSPNVLKTVTVKKSPQRGNSGGSTGGNSTSPSGLAVSSPSSTDDMNSSLLKSNDITTDPSLMNNNMFGHFKGFTLKPLPITRSLHIGATNVAFVHPVSKTVDQGFLSNGIPNRIAPPVPKPPNLIRKQSQVKPVETNIIQQNSLDKKSANAPALPPLNPGSIARPIISSPILEASTCSAKELISPLKHTGDIFDKIPQRPAPAIPVVKIEQPNINRPEQPSGKLTKDSAIKRIASFLMKDDNKGSQTLPRSLTKLNKPTIDKDKLKSIEISAPMPPASVPLEQVKQPENERQPIQNSITRTQSMRDPVSVPIVKRPVNIQTFGSMRQQVNNKTRPGSMIGTRPKSPPPPRPPAPPVITSLQIPGMPGYQNPPPPKRVDFLNDYDDCEAIEAPIAKITEDISPATSDNIYSVIDEYERPKSNITLLQPDINAEKCNSSMGLLGEIVNEIESRNLDSIYSASTLSRKKNNDTESAYINTSDSNEYTENDYINMKSNASTTSSGYLKPSAINTPIARVAPVKVPDNFKKPSDTSNNLSSFKTKNIETGTETSKDKPIVHLAQILSDNRPTNLDDKLKQIKPLNKYLNKPITATTITNKPSSPNASRKTTFNQTNKMPSNVLTNSSRGRSPSPAKNTTTTSGVLIHRQIKQTLNNKNNNTDIVSTIKNKQSDLINNSSSAQKPKPLAKPIQTSTMDSSKINVEQLKPKWQTSTKMTNHLTDNSNSTKAATSTVIINNNNNNSNANKFGGQRMGIGVGKSSNIASLQKRFENTGLTRINASGVGSNTNHSNNSNTTTNSGANLTTLNK